MNETASKANIKFASLVNRKRFLFFSNIFFQTNLNGHYRFTSKKGFELKKEDAMIYSEHLSYAHSKHKTHEAKVVNRFLSSYPIEISLGSYDICIHEPFYKDSVTAKYDIEINKKKVAELVTYFPFFKFEETYTIEFLTEKESEMDVLLFVLVFMFLRLNDSSGT